ncbi:MAG: sigma-70 family RNA polymerase sigma factor [Clostridia bacterium]|jgi:RNA polymerase sigma factor (sigma-70 family)|nr:sigma-70 family RNA polymerase sigma factor [Clostridia bacterium]
MEQTKENNAEKLFNENIRLSYVIANKYRMCGIEFEDLVQICQFALWKACKTYNRDKSTISTYACRCMNNEILQQLRKQKRFLKLKTMSLQAETIENGSTLEDIIASDFNLEDYIISKNGIESIIKNLNKQERKIVKWIQNGYTQIQIAKQLKCTQAVISRKKIRIENKIKYFILKNKEE